MNITVNIVSPSEKFRHSAAAGVMLCRLITRNWFLALCLAAGFVSNLATAAPPAREAIEWCDIWISHANETNLPRVLLIGDSIARDYYPEVEKRLAGKAFVARLATSRFVADPVLLKEIELLLTGARFDVIQFNNGMHGWQHVRRNIERHSLN